MNVLRPHLIISLIVWQLFISRRYDSNFHNSQRYEIVVLPKIVQVALVSIVGAV